MDNLDTGGGNPSGDGQNPTGGAALDTTKNEPQAIELADDALIRVKGSDKPVKFGEHVKSFQSQWTKAAQKAAQYERELAEYKRKEAQWQQQSAQRQQQNGANEDVYASLRQLPYLTGEDAVSVVQSIGDQLRQRDQVLLGALKQLQETQKIVQALNQTHSSGAFEAKISKWLQDGGYPAEASDLAKEIYLAYEGDDLDDEFPRIFNERWTQIEKILDARRQQKLREARNPRAFLPGKGGAAGPSKPLELKPDASAAEIAEQLWGQWGDPGT
jgi:hypothetical protein